MTDILHIDSSARLTGSVTRELSGRIVEKLGGGANSHTIRRDLIKRLPALTEDWIGANFTPPADRTAQQNELLHLSDQLIHELLAADTIVIGAPIYNFTIPANLKNWIDLVTRVGVTFNYTETGPKGLLENKRLIIAVASGGTKLGSAFDFSTGYLRHIFGFIGISNIEFIAADAIAADAGSDLLVGNDRLESLAA